MKNEKAYEGHLRLWLEDEALFRLTEIHGIPRNKLPILFVKRCADALFEEEGIFNYELIDSILERLCKKEHIEKEVTFNSIDRVAEEVGWDAGRSSDGKGYSFHKYSPSGNDFSIDVEGNTPEDVVAAVEDYYDSFDVCEEAYAWLDSTGHGTNGAPYDMRDVYEDFEAIKNEIEDLKDALRGLL